jgi:hypothetical protein
VAEKLHERYVPVLHFARRERFYPMAVDDFLGYCTLREKGKSAPLVRQGQVTPPLLARAYQRRPDIYLQSVPATLADRNVAAGWSSDAVRTLVDVQYKAVHWQKELARAAYQWFSAKTQPATQLFWWNDVVMSLVGTGKRSSQDLPRLNLPPEIRQAALDNYEHSQPQTPDYTYYYRTTRDRQYLCLQYWFFYGYNDWATAFGGMNDHEGDWEGMYLFFRLDSSGRPQEPPAYVTYVGHHSRLTKPWGHGDVTLDGTHPVAYVAAGSHATYPERKAYDLIKIYGLVDHATGDGVTIEPGDWRRRVDLDTQPWTSPFVGTWGTRYWLPLSWARSVLGALKTKAEEVGLPGVSAPRGPRYAEDGSIRPNWASAVTWAGILDLEIG